MIKKVHILGASGSGTTTLGAELSRLLGYKHLDTDSYFWVKTDPPFTKKRPVQERIDLIRADMKSNENWILSGSLCGWGDEFIPEFELVVYLRLPQNIRMGRLMEREKMRYGDKIKEGAELYQAHREFIEWAEQYDEGDMDVRSRKLHANWLERINCKIIRIEEVMEVEEKVRLVVEAMKGEI